MVEEDIYEMYFCGRNKKYPELCGASFVIYKNGQEMWSNSYFVSDNFANSIAEYVGLIEGLKRAINMNITRLIVKGCDQLIIKSMSGEFKVKSQDMAKMYKIAKEIEEKFESITYQNVYRKYDKRADQLLNDGALTSIF